MASKDYTRYVDTDFTGLTESKPDMPSLVHAIQQNNSITTSIDYTQGFGVIGNAVICWFKDILTQAEEDEFDIEVAAHTGVPLEDPTPALTDDNEMRVVVDQPPGDEFYRSAWNFCNECEWIENAVLVEDFEMTDSGDRITWNTNETHEWWSDIVTGRIYNQDGLFYEENADGSRGAVLSGYADYIPVVKVLPNGQADEPGNWVTKTYDTDYYIKFKTGEIVFSAALDVGDRVKATFRKSCGTYLFTVSVPSGKKLKLKYAEAHGEAYQITGWVSREINIPYGEGRIVYPGSVMRYYTLRHLALECTGAWPSLAAQGGSAQLGNQPDVLMGFGSNNFQQLPFRFLRRGELYSSLDTKYTLRLEKRWTGEFANIVLYCAIEDE